MPRQKNSEAVTRNLHDELGNVANFDKACKEIINFDTETDGEAPRTPNQVCKRTAGQEHKVVQTKDIQGVPNKVIYHFYAGNACGRRSGTWEVR